MRVGWKIDGKQDGRAKVGGMHILVTGSNGLIGSEAVTYFDRDGHDVLWYR
jgi:hypothetical protein